MKRIRILAVVVALLLSLTMLTGCNALKLEDVQSDPMKYVEDGLKLTFGSTPFASLYEEHDKASLALELKGEDIDAEAKLFLDAAEKYALNFDATYKYSDEELVEDSEMIEENINFSAYYADKQVAVKMDLLEELFGTDTLGINFGITREEFKESALFDLLVMISGMSEEDFVTAFDEAFDEEKSANLRKAFDEYLATISEIENNSYNVEGVAEETVLIGEKEYKAIAVSTKLSDKVYDDVMAAAEKFCDDVLAVVGETDAGEMVAEEDLDAYFDQVSEAMPEVDFEYNYYLSAKSGAVIKTTSKISFASEVEGEAIDISVEGETVYGANPEKLFLPEFTYKIKSGDEAIILDGKSSISEAKLLVEGALKLEFEEPDEATYTLEFAQDGAFVLVITDEEGDWEFDGSLTATENGIDFKADLSGGYEEGERKSVTDISLSLNFAEEVPALPEYKDIFDFTEDDISFVSDLLGIASPDLDEFMYNEILSYFGVDEQTLDGALAEYAQYGYPSELDYMYALYADCVYSHLRDNFDVPTETLDEIVNDVVDSGGTYYDLAFAMYETYFELVVYE